MHFFKPSNTQAVYNVNAQCMYLFSILLNVYTKEGQMHNFKSISKAKVTLRFPFSKRRERVENTQQFSFYKDKNFTILLKCTDLKQ